MPATIQVYTTGYCPYCDRAKKLLEKKGASYEEINVEGDAAKRAWLLDVTGQRTVPQVFINGKSIGGFSDMAALDTAGRLDAMLAEDAAAST